MHHAQNTMQESRTCVVGARMRRSRALGTARSITQLGVKWCRWLVLASRSAVGTHTHSSSSTPSSGSGTTTRFLSLSPAPCHLPPMARNTPRYADIIGWRGRRALPGTCQRYERLWGLGMLSTAQNSQLHAFSGRALGRSPKRLNWNRKRICPHASRPPSTHNSHYQKDEEVLPGRRSPPFRKPCVCPALLSEL